VDFFYSLTIDCLFSPLDSSPQPSSPPVVLNFPQPLMRPALVRSFFIFDSREVRGSSISEGKPFQFLTLQGTLRIFNV